MLFVNLLSLVMRRTFFTLTVLSVLSLSGSVLGRGRVLWAERAGPGSTPTGNGNIGNFGKCSVPQIVFGAGFDGRKETSYEPKDKGQCCASFHYQ
jgi:hypothetical protein